MKKSKKNSNLEFYEFTASDAVIAKIAPKLSLKMVRVVAKELKKHDLTDWQSINTLFDSAALTFLTGVAIMDFHEESDRVDEVLNALAITVKKMRLMNNVEGPAQ